MPVVLAIFFLSLIATESTEARTPFAFVRTKPQVTAGGGGGCTMDWTDPIVLDGSMSVSNVVTICGSVTILHLSVTPATSGTYPYHLQYKKNGGSWTAIGATIAVTAGDTIQFGYDWTLDPCSGYTGSESATATIRDTNGTGAIIDTFATLACT